MALLPCPECGREISSRAPACPACGCPIAGDASDTALPPAVARPEIAADLSIGSQVVNWSGGAAVNGHFDAHENTPAGIPDGNCHLVLHKKGILLAGSMYMPLLEIHFSQILDIQYVPRSVIYDEGKSVIKRAAVGGLILGPLGAVVGGMSGIGTKKKVKYKGYIILNYWDVPLDRPASLLVALDKDAAAKLFCSNVAKSLRGVANGST